MVRNDKALMLVGIGAVVAVGVFMLVSSSSGGGGYYTLPNEPNTYYPVENNTTLPENATVVTKELPQSEQEVLNYAKEYLKGVTDEFNQRYEKSLETPSLSFGNVVIEGYDTESRNIILRLDSYWSKKGNAIMFLDGILDGVIKHEFCHYFQQNFCWFGVGGESFCEVFKGSNNSIANCQLYNQPSYYCSPFRTFDLKDRQAFLDCVFEDACKMGGASEQELMGCYNTWKK